MPDSAGTRLSPVKSEHRFTRERTQERAWQEYGVLSGLHHLPPLDMFPGDAAKQQRFYISNVLKKPQQVPVRYFVQRVEQLNSYLLHLSCTYDSPRTTTATKPVQSFDEAQHANLLLCMCPESWQDQYDLSQDLLPQSVRKLLSILENVKKVVASSNTKEKATKESTEKVTGKGK